MYNSIIPFYKQSDKYIIKSQDCYLIDSEGNELLDFESGDWAAILGHSNEKVIEVIKTQAEISMHDGLHSKNRQSEELSIKLLNKLSLENGKSTFLNSGSEAVNLGISLAKNLTGRQKVLKMDCSYLSAFGHGQISSFNKDLLNIGFNKTEEIKKIDFSEIAAFILEPGSSSSLIKFPSNEFVSSVASKVKNNRGLLIANEVTTGFGRTGKWFGFQYYDYKPDIVSMGKGLGNGYPVSCVSVSRQVAEMFEKAPFRYAQSHQNDPLGCAVGIEVIKVMEENKIVEKSYNSGQYFIYQLNEIHNNFPDKVKEIRGRGLMIGMELQTGFSTEKIYNNLIEKGFVVGFKENVLRFMPPLIIEKSQIDSLILNLAKTIKNI